MKKRIISLLLVMVMVAAMLPTISLTASAKDYASGTVNARGLNAGDTIRQGVTLKSDSGIFQLREASSPTSTTSGPIIATLWGSSTATAKRNFYVVRREGSSVYLYPIPTTYITFNPNGGTAGGTTSSSKYQTVMFTSDYYDVSWLNPSRVGYNFLGWYIDNTQIYNANGITVNDGICWYNNLWQHNGSVTVTAKWEPKNFTSRVDANGGYRASDGSTEVILFDRRYGENEAINERRRTGYTLTGYKLTNSNNGSTSDLGGAVFTFDSTAKTGMFTQGSVPITLTAQWKANTYTVSFNGNGATGGSTASQNFTYDVAQNLRANGFQQKYTVTYDLGDGSTATSGIATSTFAGWNTAANGSGTAYANQQSIKNLTATDGATINLYAQWTPGSVTLPTPTKSGKVCTGWYTASGTKVGDCGDSYTPSGNVTLYARWETVGYTVTWKNYDGNTLETDEGVAQGETPTYNGATPTKPDTTEHSYVFSGWSPAISPVTGDVTYTAQFTETPRQYALSFVFDESRGQVTGNDKAPVGSVVTVNVLPNNGYGVKEIIAYKTGDQNTPVSIDSTSYSFTMPAFDVTIEVTWVEADVIYTSAYKDVAPTFTVTIPATVELGSQITVSAENVRVNKGSQVAVSMADVSGAENGFNMTSSEGYTFAYRITMNGSAISSGMTVLTVNPDTASAGAAVLTFEKPKQAIYAGTYTGTVIFTIAVEPLKINDL